MNACLSLEAGVLLVALLLGACAQLPDYTRLPVVQHPSVNYNERRPSFVILHHTGNSDTKRALNTLSDQVFEVSAHYLVARDGMIYYLVDEMKRAWHAGDSWWGGPIDMNSASIGIELNNDGKEPYGESQIAALLALLGDIQQRYAIPAVNFIGHGDIAPRRKVDPSVQFPWRRLAEHGFGLWCEPPFEPAPPGFDSGMLLRAFGYDVSNFEAAVSAFNRHFAGVESPRMTDEGRARLYCLVLKKWAGERKYGVNDRTPISCPRLGDDMNVLFICYANVGRSQVAEACFTKLSKHDCHSAGIAVTERIAQMKLPSKKLKHAAIQHSVKYIERELGIDVGDKERQQLVPEMIDSADLAIVIAEKERWPGYLKEADKVVFWDIADPALMGDDGADEVYREIQHRVKQLVAEIG